MNLIKRGENLVFNVLGTEGGGAGGIGSNRLGATSAGALTGAASGSAEPLLAFSVGVYVTVTPARGLAMRGSLRVVLTEDTVGTTAAGAEVGSGTVDASMLRSS